MNEAAQDQKLLDQLKASFDPLTPVFLLVDPLQGEPLPFERTPSTLDEVQKLREGLWQREVARIPLSTRTKLPEHMHPYVVELSGVDDPWISASLELAHAERSESQAEGIQGSGGAAHAIGGWIQTSLYPEQLAEQLAQLMTLRVIDCAWVQATYLRLADRRVLGLVRQLVGDARIAAPLLRVQSWSYLDVLGRLSAVTGLGRGGEGDAPPLRLSYDEWLRIKPGEDIQRALAMGLGELAKADESHRLILRRTEASLYASMLAAVAAATAAAKQWPHRFKADRDRHLWAVLGLLHHELLRVPTCLPSVDSFLADPGTAEAPAVPLQYSYGEIVSLLQALTPAPARR